MIMCARMILHACVHVCVCAVEPVRLFVRLCYGCAPACLPVAVRSFVYCARASVLACLARAFWSSFVARLWPSRERFYAGCVQRRSQGPWRFRRVGGEAGSCAKQLRGGRRSCAVLRCCACLSRRPFRTFGVVQEHANGKAAGFLLRTASHVGAWPAGGLVVDSGQQPCGPWPSSPEEPVRVTYIAITHPTLNSWLLILLVQWYGRADATQQVLGPKSLEFFLLLLTFDMCCVRRPVQAVEIGSRFRNESWEC